MIIYIFQNKKFNVSCKIKNYKMDRFWIKLYVVVYIIFGVLEVQSF